MPTINRYCLTLASLLVAAGLVPLAQSEALSQSGSRSGGGFPRGYSNPQGGYTQPQGRAQAPRQATFEDRFWNYLQQANYENWAPLPGTATDFYPGQSPHGAFLKVYANRGAAGNPDKLPTGSIIIKENYNEQKQLGAITVMYRGKGYDREHNDWYWVKYNPDGSVAQKNGNRLAGRVKGCADCHSGAGGGDFVFLND